MIKWVLKLDTKLEDVIETANIGTTKTSKTLYICGLQIWQRTTDDLVTMGDVKAKASGIGFGNKK